MCDSNTPGLYSQWLKSFILCNNFTGQIGVTLFCAVLTSFCLNYDVSYPISHVTLTLDGVTSFQPVINEPNVLTVTVQSKVWRDFFSVMVQK